MTVTPVGSVASRNAEVNNNEGFGAYSAVYKLDMTGNTAGASAPYGWDVTFEWPSTEEAYQLTFGLGVIDEDPSTDGYKDYAYLDSSRFAANVYPAWVAGAGTSANPWTGHNGPADSTRSLANIGLNDTLSTGVTSVTISYRGDGTFFGSEQAVGIPPLTWCL